MASNRFMIRITIRLVLIFGAMLSLSLLIGQDARLFSVISVLLLLLLLVTELFYRIAHTNRILGSMLESIHHGDFSRSLREKATDLGFESLARSAQEIISAIAAARIEKETQYQYLRTILDHIHTAVITLDADHEPELINPLALNILGIYNQRNPTWNTIRKAAPRFASVIHKLGDTGREMTRLSSTPAGKQLLILVNTVRIGGNPVKIVTFQDIEPEIEQKEMESWQTISRIMAHEIMNSLTPLSSLTETGIMLLEEKGKPREVSEISQETIDNLHTALRTIADRNEALTRFIGSYRQLSRLPRPEKKRISVQEILEEVSRLHQAHCAHRGITCTIHPGPGQLTIMADEAQLKQVLINLVKNALEALDGTREPCLSITVKRILDDVALEISDNGPGIPPVTLEKIFVPFFTTKPEGSGIGLSLSRQIIRNHGGQLSVDSEPGRGTAFRITLPVE